MSLGTLPDNELCLALRDRVGTFYEAADPANLRRAIAFDPSLVRHRSASGYTFLHEAAASGDLAAVTLLIGAGAEVDARDARDATPLMEAALAKQAHHVRVLMEAGAEINAVNNDGQSALSFAIDQSDEIVDLLLSNGAHVDIASAIRLGRWAEVERRLHDNATDLGCDSKIAANALVAAIDSPYPAKMVEMLLRCGANPDGLGVSRETPLCRACRLHSLPVEVTRLLLKHGAGSNCVCGDGLSPLQIVRRRPLGRAHPHRAEIVALLKGQQ